MKLVTTLHDKRVPIFSEKATSCPLKFSDVISPSLLGLISCPRVVGVELMLDWCVGYGEGVGCNAGGGVQPDGNEVHCRLEHPLHAVWEAAEVNMELNFSVCHF